MIRLVLVAFAFAFPLAFAVPAYAQQGPSTSEAQAVVTADTGCQRHDYPNLEMTLYACDRGLTYWYFTVPNDHVPPGYIRRAMVVRDGAAHMETRGHYDGTNAQKSDFDAWTTRLVASLQH